MIDDGGYDVVVTDVARGEGNEIIIELVIATGPEKGGVVRLRNAMDDEPIEWLGLPGHLRVEDGVPLFRLDTT